MKVSLLILCFLFSFYSQASTALSKEQTAQRISELVDDNSTTPKEVISELDQLIAHSKQQHWIENYASGQTLKAEFLIALEQLGAAEQIVNEMLPIAKENQLERLMLRLKLIQLSISNTSGLSPQTLSLIAELLEAAKQWPDGLDAASIYSSVGQSYYMHQMFDQSITYLKKAYDIYLPINDVTNQSYVLNSLSNLYSELGDFETAIEYLDQAIAINRKLEDIFSVSIMLYNKGKVQTLANNLPQALETLNESYSIAIEIEDELGQIWAKQAIADVLLRQKKPEKALAMFKESAPVFAENGDKREHFHAMQGMYDSYFLLEQYEKCKELAPQLLELLTQLNSDSYNANINKRFSQLEEQQGNFQQAYQYLLTYSGQQEKLFEKEKKQNIQHLKINFDTEKKDHLNKLLQSKNQLQQLKIDQQQSERNLWLLIVAMATVLIIVIAILLYRQMQSRDLYRKLAHRDTLTDSPNRRAILNTAKLQYKQENSIQTQFSVAIVDLDKFKLVNDIYGHDVGDEVLIAFSQTCKETLRKLDNFGRYGGEEWLFVFSESQSDITKIFERIREHLNNKHISGYPKEKLITFSVGVASVKTDSSKDLQDLINKADEYLYQAKNNGRDTIVFNSTSHKLGN